MESIGQLAAGIAHEINTPAQYVGDNTRFIKETMEDVMGLVNAFQRLYAASCDDTVTPELIKECGELIDTADPEYLAEEVPAAIAQTLDGTVHARVFMLLEHIAEQLAQKLYAGAQFLVGVGGD